MSNNTSTATCILYLQYSKHPLSRILIKLTEELECEEMNADVGRGVDQTVVAVPQLRRVTRDLGVLNNLDIVASHNLWYKSIQ